MNKADLVEILREKANASKADAALAVDALFDAMAKALKQDGGFTIVGFGTFKTTERAAREGRNPQTGAPIAIPASKSVHFKPSSQLKERL